MQLIQKFHHMESEEGLFDVCSDIKFPLWDIIRYSVYVKYYYPEEDRKRLSITHRHSFRDYFDLFFHAMEFACGLPLAKGQNVVITSSRSLDQAGRAFDKCAIPLIQVLASNCLVIEPILGKRIAYKYLYDFNCVFQRFYRGSTFPRKVFDKLNEILIKHLSTSLITYEEINDVYHAFQSDYWYYSKLFRFLNTKKVFISTGNPKAVLLAAREHGARTYLLQHAGIEVDEIDYSYPVGVSATSNILFADALLTLGDYWCKEINVPVRTIIPIGNDYFNSKPQVLSDDSLLVISTIVHGEKLKVLTKVMAEARPDLIFVYKLHPNEYQFYKDYLDFFKSTKNVHVVSTQVDINTLIAKSQLVLLIVSAVLYEALNQHKKVAIYKRVNYERQLHLSRLPNLFFVDGANDVFEVLSMSTATSNVMFYKPTDYNLISDICLER